MRKLKSDRNIITYILLNLLTFGIYGFWYLHHLVKDVNEICRENGQQSPGILPYILLSLVTCGIYSLFWWYRLADMLATAAKKRGVETSISGGYVLVCLLLGSYVCGIAAWIGIHSVFQATNDLATDYNSKLWSPINPESESVS